MVKEVTRYWFLVESKGSPILSYIVSAVSPDKARESFGSLVEQYNFKQLTNDELVTSTGCCLPSRYEKTQLAMNDVMFQAGCKFFIIRVAD